MDLTDPNMTFNEFQKKKPFNKERKPFEFEQPQVSKSEMNRHYMDRHYAVTKPLGWNKDVNKARRVSPLIATKLMKDMMAV